MLRTHLCCFLLVCLSCAPEAIQAPRGAILGWFGGYAVGLEAQVSSVRAHFVCFSTVFPAPLVPDSLGRFSLPRTQLRQPNDRSFMVSAVGSVANDSIYLDVTIENGRTSLLRYRLARDKPIESSGVACQG